MRSLDANSALIRYSAAVVCVAASSGLCLSLDPVLGSGIQYILFAPSVLFATRIGGRGPGLLATALGGLAGWYFLLEPRFSFAIPDSKNVAGLCLITVVGVAISLFGVARQPARAASSAAIRPGGFHLRRLAILGGVFLGAAVLGRVLYLDLRAQTTRATWISHSYQVLKEIRTVQSALADAETSQRGYLVTDDSAYLEPYGAALARQRDARGSLRALTYDDAGQQHRLDALEPLIDTRLALLDRVLALRRTTDPNTGLDAERSGAGKSFMDECRAILHAMEEAENSLLISRLAASDEQAQRSRWILALGFTSLLLLLLLAMAVIERDAGRREAALRALETSEARVRKLGDNLPQGAIYRYRIDAQGEPHVDFMSAGIEQLTGTTAADFMRDAANLDGNVLPEDSARLDAAIEESRSKLTRFEIEVRHRHRGTGEIRWSLLRSTPERLPDGATAWDGVEIDITSRKIMEAALRESENRYRSLVEQASDPIFVHDLQGRFVDANRLACQSLGYTRDELLSLTVFDVECDFDKAAALAVWQSVPPGSPLTLTGTHRRKDGSRFSVEVRRGAFLFDGQPLIIGLVRDTTERLRMEQELRTLNVTLEGRVRERTAQLEAVNQELESFAYSVSHDLRSPLRRIDGWSLALIEDFGDQLAPKAHGYVDRVRAEAHRMSQLIDDMIELARIARVPLAPAPVDLTAIGGSVARRLLESNPARDIDFLIAPSLEAVGDSRLLSVALTNLLENAVKFTSPRSRARIELGQTRVNGGAAAPFYVRDNGVGFDMAFAKRLFTAFERLHKSSEFPGTGIGLATVQRVIARHEGRIWAESKVDEGTTFYFTLSTP